MNTAEIYNAIERIAGISSTKAKLEELKRHIGDDMFRKVCLYAYHPHYAYGLKDSLDDLVPFSSEGRDFTEGTWDVLDALIDGSLSGNEAIGQVNFELSMMNAESGALLKRIIRKDLRCGISKTTINKAHPGLIPEFPYMRCCLPKDANFDKFSWKEGCISQEKADGMFANVNAYRGGKIEIYGREGNPFNKQKFTALVLEMAERLCPFPDQSASGWQYHGEILVERDGKVLPREIANGIINSLNNGDYELASNERVLYQVWDRITLEAVIEKKHNMFYHWRFTHLVQHLMRSLDERIKNPYHGKPPFAVNMIPTKVVHSLEEAKAHFKEMTAQGKEGTILKDGRGIWKNGTSKEQVKFKVEFDCDLKIVGFVDGQKATKNEGRVGSITCESADGKLRVDVSIKGEAMRDDVDANKANWLGKIMTVKANNIMPPTESNELYSLFLPRFVESRYRVDKSEADSLERIQNSFESAI